MSNTNTEDQDSSTMDDNEPIEAGLNVAGVESSATSPDPFRKLNEVGLIWLERGIMERDYIVSIFSGSLVTVIGSEAMDVIGVHKNMHTSVRGLARLGAFPAHVAAMANRRGYANVTDAWYGGSKEEICSIIANGFVRRNGAILGVELSPLYHPFKSVMTAAEDENGLRHILLCRVILGNMGMMPPGAEHGRICFNHSEVDSIVAPKKYIIGTANMDCHILPCYALSFKLPGDSTNVRFAAMMNELPKHLHPSKMATLAMHHKSYLENKIGEKRMLNHMRLIAGDSILRVVIKSIRLATSNNRNI